MKGTHPIRRRGSQRIIAPALLLLMISLPAAIGQVFTPSSAPATNWLCVASSATGSNLFVGGQGPENTGPIYVSHNAGSSWSESGAPIARWLSMAASGDGSIVIAGTDDLDPALFVSTNSGASWTSRTPLTAFSGGFAAIALSPDAHFLLAANSHFGRFNGSQILLSTNLGLDWLEVGNFGVYVQSLACSADGNTIIAGSYVNPGYTKTWFSTNGGITWTATYPPGFHWQSVTCSPDGTKPFMTSGTGTSGPIYWSADAGATSHQITNSDAYGRVGVSAFQHFS